MNNSTIQTSIKTQNKVTGERSKPTETILGSFADNVTIHDLFTLMILLLVIVAIFFL